MAATGLRRPMPLPTSGPPGPLIALGVGLCYVALAQYVIWLSDPVNAGAGYWPAAGLTLGALLLLPPRRWGWVLGAVVVAEIGGDAAHGYPLAASGWWAAGNVVEPFVAAMVLRQVGGGGRLAPLRSLASFLLAGVVLGPLVGAAIGSVGTSSVYDVDRFDVLVKWWAGDGLGVLVVAPLLLIRRERPVPDRRHLEVGGIIVSAVVVSLLAFRGSHDDWGLVLPYLIVPLLVVAGVRLGIRGAAVVGFVVAEVANVSTALGYGPFQTTGPTGADTLVALQVFLASALTAGLVIATLVQEAVEGARRYERQRSVADALQFAVMSAEAPDVPGIEVSARYVPADDDTGLHIGGDWYDVFDLEDGSTVFVVGDLMGHNVEAAVAMAQLRNGLRTLMIEVAEPARVVDVLNRQLFAGPDTMLATLIVAVYRDGTLAWTSAGHLPLLLASASSVRYLEEPPNRIIGVGPSPYDTHHLVLEEDDLLVAFTDGLIEHRARPLRDGLDRLRALVAAHRGSTTERICDVLIAEAMEGLPRDDDACVLAMRRRSAPPVRR